MSLISLKDRLDNSASTMRSVGKDQEEYVFSTAFPTKYLYALAVAIIGGLVGIYLNTGTVAFQDFIGMVIASGIVACFYFVALTIGSFVRPN